MTADRQKQLVTRKGRMRRHLALLQETVENDQSACFEKQETLSPETFFQIDEQLQKIESLFSAISTQVDDAGDLLAVSRCGDRIAFVEERLDEVEAALFQRPRRRRRSRPNFARFFQFSQQGQSPKASDEVSSLAEAYRTLGLEEGTPILGVTRAFRRFVKEYHPDTRGGDRSTEGQLRRALESYQLIKEHLENNPS